MKLPEMQRIFWVGPPSSPSQKKLTFRTSGSEEGFKLDPNKMYRTKETGSFNQEFIKFWYILCNNLLITSNNHFYQCRDILTCERRTGLCYLIFLFYYILNLNLNAIYWYSMILILPEWIFGILDYQDFHSCNVLCRRSEWIFGPRHQFVVCRSKCGVCFWRQFIT